MSYNINDVCRVCLMPTTTRKNSNLFFSSGRSVQLWAKVMACAWVQVFEGDGLPSQICHKCHYKLDIAYQFKQQCEASDTQIRQFLNRGVPNKVPSSIDLIQTQPECFADCKPLNFNITNECLDLAQTDLSLSSYRFMNQDTSLSHIDAAMKQEPGFAASLNLFNPLSLPKGDCQLNASFKCESLNDSDAMLDSFSAKLFESVDASIHQSSSETVDQIDSKLAVWDLQQKQQTQLINKTDFLLHSVSKEHPHKSGKEIDKSVMNESEDLSFLADDRSVSPLCNKINSLPDLSPVFPAINSHTECDAVAVVEKLTLEVNSKSIDEIPPDVQKIDRPKIITRKRKKINKENQSTKEDDFDTFDKISNSKRAVQEQCELCGKVFKYRSYMVQHLRTHTGDKPFHCSHCDQKFAMYRSLVTHLRIHSGDKPFICAVCGKRFTQSTGLKSHMRAHSGEKPFECEICAKKFSQRSNLLIHKQIHTGQRDHVCNVCYKPFKFYKHLQSHMKLHSGQKEFKCSVCQKCFHRKSSLRTHLSIHSGERPFKCTECGHAFSNSSNLRAHSRIHSGVKPYKCRICKKAFAQSSAVKRHMQQHTLPTSAAIKD